MNPEETKVKDFFEKLKKIDMNSWAAWFFVGFSILFLVICCVIPVQDYLESDGEAGRLMFMITSIVGPFIAYMRIQPLTIYTENQKGRAIFDLLKYYPVDKKEIKKMKIIHMSKFMSKTLLVCMLAQIPATLYSYGKVSIINFLYILVVAFVWPIVWNAVFIWFEK